MKLAKAGRDACTLLSFHWKKKYSKYINIILTPAFLKQEVEVIGFMKHNLLEDEVYWLIILFFKKNDNTANNEELEEILSSET